MCLSGTYIYIIISYYYQPWVGIREKEPMFVLERMFKTRVLDHKAVHVNELTFFSSFTVK